MVGRKMVPPPSRALSEGRGWRWWEGDSPPSRVSRKSGWLELARPLRLAFQARERVGGGWKENGPPSVSRFERGRGMEVVGKETTLRLAFRGDRVVGRPLRLAFRAREGDGGGWKDSGGGCKHHLSHEMRGGGSCWAK